MTRKNREASRFPAKSPASKISRRRQKTPKRSNYAADDYTNSTTPSQSQNYQNESDNSEDDYAQNLESRTNESFNNHRLLLPPPEDDNPPLNSSNLSQPTNQSSSYIKIAPFPIFRGERDECPLNHMSRFTKVSRANNASSIDMMMRIFPVTLENEAALWYDLNIDPYPSLSWEEIRSSFLLRLQWVLQRWPDHGIPDTLIRGIFIDGLREDFRQWIIPQKPENLDDVLRLAFTWEQVRSIRMAGKRDIKCGFCEGAHEEKGCEIRERMRGLWLDRMGRRECDEAVEAAVARSVSGQDSRGNDTENEMEKMLGGKKKCRCSKHQCWKKSFESGSVVTRNSNKEG